MLSNLRKLLFGRLIPALSRTPLRGGLAFAKARIPQVGNLFRYARPTEIQEMLSGGGRYSQILLSHKGHRVGKWLQYAPTYDFLLEMVLKHVKPIESSQINILEIGVSHGGSLEIWREYFGPRATVIGIDIDPRCGGLKLKDCQIRVGSQSDVLFLKDVASTFAGPIAMVVDDGSHQGPDQIVSFEALWPLVAEGGLYIVEDLHTSYWSEFHSQAGSDFLTYCGEILDLLHSDYHSCKFRNPELHLRRDISALYFFESIVAIRKGVRPQALRLELPTR